VIYSRPYRRLRNCGGGFGAFPSLPYGLHVQNRRKSVSSDFPVAVLPYISFPLLLLSLLGVYWVWSRFSGCVQVSPLERS
jgi:hypothetical protein